jgi:hypothetical protein
MSDYFDLADKAVAQAYPGQRGWWGVKRIPNYGILRGAIELTIRTVLAEKDKDIEELKAKWIEEITHLKGLLAEQERAIAFLRESIRMSGLLNDENNKQITHLKGLLAEATEEK